ncbi:hypothetical protein GGI20_001429 [Coemansia sp. BCRC 34301]|nr:hypothetical protein GGI20_001429 [Coemansia sp. BCRC 34301]
MSASSSRSSAGAGGGRTNPHTASTPELLLSGVLPELLEHECRPRSWSTRSEAGLERRPPNRQHSPSVAGGSPGRSSTFSGIPLAQPRAVPMSERASYTGSSVQRASSIYSKGGGSAASMHGSPDGQVSRIQPRVATMSAGSSHPVMARGQIIAPQTKPHSPGLPPAAAIATRKQALSMMKPLALQRAEKEAAPVAHSPVAAEANSEPASPAESATASAAVAPGNASTAVDSASSHHTSASSRRGSCNSATASDTDGAVSLLKNPRQRASSKAGPAVGTVSALGRQPSTTDCSDQNQQKQQESPRQSAVWSAYSWLTRRTSSTGANQYIVDASDSLRRSAVSHLRDIQAQQPEQPVSCATEPAADRHQQQCEDDTAADQTSEPTADTATPDQHAADPSDTCPGADVASAAGNAADSRVRWAWGWFGAGKNTPQPSLDSSEPPSDKRDCYAEEHTDNLHDLPLPDSAFDSCVPDGNIVAADLSGPSGNVSSGVAGSASQRPLVNMLIPDLDFDSVLAMSATEELDDITGEPADHSDGGSGEADKLAPSWHSRVHGLGKTLLQGAIAIAPDWARLAILGHASADTLGQLDDGSRCNESPSRTNSQKIKDAVDVSAHKLGKIAVIGVHGWFPTRMLQMISGEPTGKSEKFCVMMRDAIKEYLQDTHGIRVENSDISLFPLVGEGRIEDRVELLLSQITDVDDPAEGQQRASGLGRSGSGSRPASSLGVTSPVAERNSKLQAKGSTLASSSDPTSSSARRSEMIAEVLMPDRKRRAETLKTADTVFVVTHSQGTPVSAMLIERLIELELLEPRRQRIGMLAMAGISHGPLPYLKDNVVIKYIESEAARELFELMDPSSPQSQRYVGALSTILHKGVRLICIGSWVDEVVPLYSAIIQGVSHPNVYRAMYVDAHHYLDDFLTNLIVFALRLRNMGLYDHDLLTHLSEVVAGSLWGHSGHSTIYAEPAVFKLALKWLLYSTSSVPLSSSTLVPAVALGLPVGHQHAEASASGLQIHMSYRPFNAAERLNPFFIPWIMRTLWDEPEIRQNEGLRMELQRLVALFDKWAPETKAGKELKYRLEPVRAAL